MLRHCIESLGKSIPYKSWLMYEPVFDLNYILIASDKSIYVLRKVGISTVLELSCAKWEFLLCWTIPEW